MFIHVDMKRCKYQYYFSQRATMTVITPSHALIISIIITEVISIRLRIVMRPAIELSKLRQS